MTTETRQYEYVVLSHSFDLSRENAPLWWDGEQVQSDPPGYCDSIRHLPLFGTPETVARASAFVEHRHSSRVHGKRGR